jgi:RNA polymerase sigma factor (sigma-70 family)
MLTRVCAEARRATTVGGARKMSTVIKRCRHMRRHPTHARAERSTGRRILTIQVSTGDMAAAGIEPVQTGTERRTGVRLTHRRLSDECLAGGEPIPVADPVLLRDAELMARVSVGSVDCFFELYDRYCDRAYRVARSVCKDDGRALEAVQDGFLAVWNSRANFHSQQGSVAAWLLTVVRYRALDAARSNHRHSSRRADDDSLTARSPDEDPVETAGRREEAERVRASLAALPDAQAEVIVLAHYGRLTDTEIAAQLGLPRGTVKDRMRLGLQRLRADLDRVAA